MSDDGQPLVFALARGDAAADREVRSWVRRFLASPRLGLPVDVRSDVEQEVMMELWRAVKQPRFDAARELGGFVRVLCARRAIDWWRRTRPAPADVAADEIADRAPGPLEEVLSGERRELARSIFSSLSDGCRELLRLQAVERLTYREIAARWGRSEGALRVQLHRCIEQARLRLRPADEAAP